MEPTTASDAATRPGSDPREGRDPIARDTGRSGGALLPTYAWVGSVPTSLYGRTGAIVLLATTTRRVQETKGSA